MDMEDDDGKNSFWDRFDLHVKRWQTVCALIVASGSIVAFVGTKLGWHWPTWPGTDESTVSQEQEAEMMVRFLDEEWSNKIDLRDANPSFQISAGYYNVSDSPKYDVLLRVQYDTRLSPIKGTGVVRNATNPNGLAVDDSLVDDWLNIGNYGPDANAYARYMFMLRTDDFPCGDTTLTLRTFVRVNDSLKVSPEALVVYHRACDPPLN